MEKVIEDAKRIAFAHCSCRDDPRAKGFIAFL